MMNEIKAAQSQLTAAHKAMLAALRRAWPEGTEVSVLLRSDQTRPSRGIVIAHHSDGALRVRLIGTRRGAVKSIHHSNVLP